jgi:hypothetical protein
MAEGGNNDVTIQVAPPEISEGSPLPDSLRHNLETAFGADFSTVRVHEGHEATMLGAQAFTQGGHIHFAPGLYQPFSEAGRDLLGHELTHVVQQGAGQLLAPGLVSTDAGKL